jgi:ectoine hydroxylase-related dioxygenase (phytanoyl-CoA dioxygenase family)
MKMSDVFLSESWFRRVDEIQKDAPGNGGPVLNLVVCDGPEGEKRAHVAGTRFGQGHASEAAATVTLPFEIAHAIFVEGRFRDAMPAFTAGKIQIDGQLAALASIARSDGDELRELRNRLLTITRPASDGPSLVGPAAGRAAALREVERLGLAPYVRKLEVDGYAVIPREVAGMTLDLIDRVREKVLDVVERRTGVRPNLETGETHRNVFYPSLYYYLFEDRIFEELLMNEVALAMASSLLGDDCVVSACAIFMKGPADPPRTGSKVQLGLHADHLGFSLPEPYPHPSEVPAINITWLMTDYSVDEGATVFVPGSHYFRRMPIGFEGEERMVPLEAPRGTLVVWGGNTWHGSLPRKKPGLRIGGGFALTKPWLAPQEPFQLDVTEEILARNSPRFAVLMGQTYPTGWRGEGPEALMAARARAAAKRQGRS